MEIIHDKPYLHEHQKHYMDAYYVILQEQDLKPSLDMKSVNVSNEP